MEEELKPKDKLTVKQELFCQYYVSNGFNAAQACRSAGYSEKTSASQGSRMLTDPKIQKFIDEYRLEVNSQIDISKETLLEKLNQMVLESPEGIKLKAIDMINKMLGHYAPEKQEVTHSKYSEIEDAAQNMTDDELEKILESMGNSEADKHPKIKRVK
jgi:phage terminase small subunit